MEEVEIFSRAIEISSETERRAFVLDACAGDEAMLHRICGLIQSHDSVDDFLEPLPEVKRLVDSQPYIEQVGGTVGPYKLLQELGEGGFGLVFLAERRTPIRQRVALKIIKPGMDTTEVIARFEAERQTLALMDHPNIARVFDAGMTESGRPYFVMELIRGEPIADYCDQNRLGIRERLELFANICLAVQHAHQKGIIHRDIKPSNVLVSTDQQSATPKVIDFGVAKATTSGLSDKSAFFTRYGQVIGSLFYMSPEQAVMSSLDVDTRSDIYSLGALLYELLTGQTAVERNRFDSLTYEQSKQVICDEESPKPSSRVSSLGEHLTAVAAARSVDVHRLPRLLRGELDWIVMKAMEKDRTRRYQTASGLADDVRRYLDGEAVEAGPPSAMYKLQKLARKHHRLLLTSASFFILLIAASGLSTWLAIDATRARKAELAERNRVVENYAGIISQFPARFTYSRDLATFVFVAAFASGDWERAETELRLASEKIGPTPPAWWQTHWWAVGPYTEDLSATYPPQTHLDPFQPVPSDDPGEPPLWWIPSAANAKGGVGIGSIFIGEDIPFPVRLYNSAFLQTRVFTFTDCTVDIVFRARAQARIWLNGVEFAVQEEQSQDQVIESVQLRAGWNTLLAHVVNRGKGNHHLYLQIREPSTSPFDSP